MFIIIAKKKYHFCCCCFGRLIYVKDKELRRLVRTKKITDPED